MENLVKKALPALLALLLLALPAAYEFHRHQQARADFIAAFGFEPPTSSSEIRDTQMVIDQKLDQLTVANVDSTIDTLNDSIDSANWDKDSEPYIADEAQTDKQLKKANEAAHYYGYNARRF